MKSAKTTRKSRRDFLTKVVTVCGVTGAGAVAASVFSPFPDAQKRQTMTEQNKPSGYRETEHIRTYYQKAKF